MHKSTQNTCACTVIAAHWSAVRKHACVDRVTPILATRRGQRKSTSRPRETPAGRLAVTAPQRRRSQCPTTCLTHQLPCTAVYRKSALSDEEITAIHEAASNARASARATLRRSAKGGGEHAQTWLQASCVEEFLTPAFHSCIRKLIAIMHEADRASGWGLLSSEGDLRGGDVQQSSIRQTHTSGGGLTLALTCMLTLTPTPCNANANANANTTPHQP